MSLSVTLVVPASGARVDVVVTAEPGDPAPPVLDALRVAAGVPRETTLSINHRPLAADGTLADSGLVAGAVVVAGDAGEAIGEPYALTTASGPDAGRQLPVPSGACVVGRTPDCDLTVEDAAVSREHLRIDRRGSLIAVTDLRSANGTTLDGDRLAAGVTAALPEGSRLRIGDTEIVLASSAVTTEGRRLVIDRRPRLVTPPPKATVAFPARATPPPRTRLPILAAIAPLVAGFVLAMVLHQWQLLAFTVLSPVMVGGQAISDRLAARRSARAADAGFASGTAAASRRLEAALSEERERRHAAGPDLASLVAAATNQDRLLWLRGAADPDLLVLRLGRGDDASEVELTGATQSAVLTDVPITLPLKDIGHLGVCGRRDLVLGVTRAVLAQAATWHAPSVLRVVVLAPMHCDDWSWVRWLPHASGADASTGSRLVAFDDTQLTARLDELALPTPEAGDATPWRLVVDDGCGSRTANALASLQREPGHRLTVVSCAPDADSLPSGIAAIAALDDSPRPRLSLRRRGQGELQTIAPDLIAGDVAERVARALAPLREGQTPNGHNLARVVRWTALEGLDLTNPARAVDALSRRWQSPPSTVVALGDGVEGTVTVDLARDGPHALIAGTTGSGKSELLLDLVASLVAANRPDQLALLLFDHKGGAAFGRCARLPHTVGVVTDLDAASTTRALLSLTAELHRRESAFAATGVAELDAYLEVVRRDGDDAGLASLARLVIIVDEFATLAEEQPDVIRGLVAIAQRGRSLGVHLVLATQRPDGVVSADIRANTRLRICLGVTRESESRDIIDSPIAATISRENPGRGYLRIGHTDLREFQSGLVSGPSPRLDRPLVRLAPAAMIGAPDTWEGPPTESAQHSELEALIDAAATLSERLGCATPARPWLPPLPTELTLADLRPDESASGVPWGLVDLPTVGRQDPLVLDLATGSTTVISGASRSGRTSATVGAAVAAAAARSPDELQLWVVGTDSGLTKLQQLPHCGATVPAADIERVERLLELIGAEVGRRRQTPAEATAAEPLLMLLVDSWEDLTTDRDHRDVARLTDLLLALAADGPAARTILIITSGRAGLTGRLTASATHRIVLRLADPADYPLIGLASQRVPAQLGVGRGFRADDLSMVQLAVADTQTWRRALNWPAPTAPAARLEPLPDRVPLASIRRPTGTVTDLVLGLAAYDLAPIAITRRDVGASFIVAGPPRSGRTTALALLAAQRRDRRVAVSCVADSPLLELPGVIALPRDDQDHAVAILDSLIDSESDAPDLIVDDADLLIDGPLTSRLEDQVRTARPGRIVVLGGSTDALLAAFRGPVAQARRARTGLLLCPSSSLDGELFGARLPRRVRGGDPPGRGWLVRRGSLTRLQIADPTS